MSTEDNEATASPDPSDDDEDLFADSDEEIKTEEPPEPTAATPTRVTRSIVAALKSKERPPVAIKIEPEPTAAVESEGDTLSKPEEATTVYASIPRKHAPPSSPKASPSSSLPSKSKPSPIPKKTTPKSPVVLTSPAGEEARAAKFGLPKGTRVPSSIKDDVLRHSGGKVLDQLRGLRSVSLINDALKEYDDAVQIKGEASIRNHGAYLLGVVKRYINVQERASRTGADGASIPMGNELTPPVHQRLQKLIQNGVIKSEELNRNDKLQMKLRMLSEKDALSAIEEMASVERTSIRNFGSYFMGILNRYMRREILPIQQQYQDRGTRGGRNRSNSREDPNEAYRRERSRDRGSDRDRDRDFGHDRDRSRDRGNNGHYGPRGDNNPHLPSYDTRRGGGGPSPYENNNSSNYPAQSRYQHNSNTSASGPPPPPMGSGPMGGGKFPPPPPPPPPRQSAGPGLPPPPPNQYQALSQGQQVPQQVQSHYGAQQQQHQPPSHYGAQQAPPTNRYGQPPPQAAPPPQQPPHQQHSYGAQQQPQPKNSYYGSQNQPQPQQPYGTNAPSPYGSVPGASGVGQPPQQQQHHQQQHQQSYMQQQPPPQPVPAVAPQSMNGYPQQQQQQQPPQQQRPPSRWQQPGAVVPAPNQATSMPAGLMDILGIADKAASAVQALQSQNRIQNPAQQQQQQHQQALIQQQPYQPHQAAPQQAPPMQQPVQTLQQPILQPQQPYQAQQSYQQPQQQQIQQPPPQQHSSSNQYGGYGATPPAAAPYANGAPTPYAPQHSAPMGQSYQQQQQHQHQQQQHHPHQGHMGGHHSSQQPYSQQREPQPSQHSSPPNRGNRGRGGKSRRTTANISELPISVQHMIHNIQNSRQVDGPLDEGILGMIKDLPEDMAIQSLNKFNAIDKNSMRSKTAYLAGVLRRELERIHRR